MVAPSFSCPQLNPDNVYSFFLGDIHSRYFSGLLTRIDRSVSISEQIHKCCPETQESARRIASVLREDNQKSLGLDSSTFLRYKNAMRLVASSLNSLVDELLSYPCNVPVGQSDRPDFIPASKFKSFENYVFKKLLLLRVLEKHSFGWLLK